MIMYGYDICDSDKGIIVASNYEEAVAIYKRSYDEPVVGVDCEEYSSKTCQISKVADLSDKPRLYYLFN